VLLVGVLEQQLAVAGADALVIERLGQQPGAAQIGHEAGEGVEHRPRRLAGRRRVGVGRDGCRPRLVERVGPLAEHPVDHVGDPVPRPHPGQGAAGGRPPTGDGRQLEAHLEHQPVEVVAADAAPLAAPRRRWDRRSARTT
jgi:hypothetical protein